MSVSRRAALLGLPVALPVALGGCSLFDNWFGESKPPLPGTRESVVAARRGLELDSGDRRAIVIPAAAPQPDWPMAGGGPTHAVGNVAVSGLQRSWRSSIGDGGGYRARITAQPVVADGRVFTMDSDGQVSAFDAGSGSRLWRADTQGDEDRSTNIGGGLAVVGGVLYATTGRAEALTLDPASGRIGWRKPLGSPARSGPTVAEGRLHLTTLDDRLVALSAADGERVWSYQATNTSTTVLAQAAPAVSEGLVVAGFGSGDLVTVRSDSGVLAWSDSLASARGRNSRVDLSAIRALPVVDRGRVYAIGIGGLMVALDLRSGRRLWERDVGGGETPWLAGDWLFVQTSEQALAAVNRDDGRVRWISELPRWDNPDKRKDPLFWTGPVMAGGKLILAGTNEFVFSVDPVTGTVLGRESLRGPATVPPLAAAGSVFIVTDDGSISAFR